MSASLHFPMQWFVANYLFQLALEPNEAALVTLLSSTSTFFTLVLAAFFPSSSGDKFTLSKFVAVIFCLIGVVSIFHKFALKSELIEFHLIRWICYSSRLWLQLMM